MHRKLFVYGTLTFPEVLRAVLGYSIEGRAAWLYGYRAVTFQGAAYPGLVRDAHARTAGRLYSSLTRAQLQRLDAYEGHLYQRTVLPVLDERGRRVPANVYVVRARYRPRLSACTWIGHEFRAHDQGVYLAHLRRRH